MTERSTSNGHRPTLLHVAERAGVSKSLVSLVMRGEPTVRAEKRRRVLRALVFRSLTCLVGRFSTVPTRR